MTAAEWNSEFFDRTMIAFLGWNESGFARKRRLYLIALCRHFWSSLECETARAAIDATESYVEEQLSTEQLRTFHESHRQFYLAYISERGKRSVHAQFVQLMACALEASDPAGCRLVPVLGAKLKRVAIARLKEIFGHLVLIGSFDSAWRSSKVLGLAQSIYQDRFFEQMPMLADALTDAGCSNEQILAHCHNSDLHVRGCWVLDLILGKS